jgi:hypothetical protein
MYEKRPCFTSPGTSKPGRFTYFALSVRNASRVTSSGASKPRRFTYFALKVRNASRVTSPGTSKPRRFTYSEVNRDGLRTLNSETKCETNHSPF